MAVRQRAGKPISVTAEATPIDTTKNDVAGRGSPNQQMETLPINSRQYLNLALLMPGYFAGFLTHFSTTSVPNGRFRATTGPMDSRSMALPTRGRKWASRARISRRARSKSLRVNTIQLLPRNKGLSAGGVISIATKSGTNQFHGRSLRVRPRRNSSIAITLSTKLPNSRSASAKKPFRRNQFRGAASAAPSSKKQTALLPTRVRNAPRRPIRIPSSRELPGTNTTPRSRAYTKGPIHDPDVQRARRLPDQ